MKMKTLLLLLLSVACASAQNVAVRYLHMDLSHEWHGTNGCPTNFPVAMDRIGTNTVSPYANRVVIAQSDYAALTNSIWSTFWEWKNNQWAKFVADRQPAINLALWRAGAKETYDATESFGRLQRAFAVVLLAEINALRDEINHYRTNATPPRAAIPQRTPAQVRTAIRNELDNQP